jgi:hypothetical protein
MVFVSIWKMFVWISGVIVYYKDESIMELKQHAILKAIASLFLDNSLQKQWFSCEQFRAMLALLLALLF